LLDSPAVAFDPGRRYIAGMENQAMQGKAAILDLNGATCASCVYAIEHLGRKVQGVTDIAVNAALKEIRVEYEGNPGSLERIAEIVHRLGYEATIRWDTVQ